MMKENAAVGGSGVLDALGAVPELEDETGRFSIASADAFAPGGRRHTLYVSSTFTKLKMIRIIFFFFADHITPDSIDFVHLLWFSEPVLIYRSRLC